MSDYMMDEDYDELADVRAESEAQDPAFAGAYEDARSRSALLAQLIKVRKDLKLTQKQVAERMGTTQSAISELEGGASDPQFSTLQRYARAVTAKLVLSLDLPYDCAWNDQTLYSREGSVARVNARAVPGRPVGSIRDWVGHRPPVSAVRASSAKTQMGGP